MNKSLDHSDKSYNPSYRLFRRYVYWMVGDKEGEPFRRSLKYSVGILFSILFLPLLIFPSLIMFFLTFIICLHVPDYYNRLYDEDDPEFLRRWQGKPPTGTTFHKMGEALASSLDATDSGVRKIIGVDQGMLGDRFETVLNSALRTSVKELVVVCDDPSRMVWKTAQMAFESGSGVRLIRSPHDAPSNTEWLKSPIN